MKLETKRQLIHASGAGLSFYVIYAGLYLSVITFLFLFVEASIIGYGYKKGVRLPIISKIVDSTERAGVIDKFPGKGTITFFFGRRFAAARGQILKHVENGMSSLKELFRVLYNKLFN